jgi:hypothetical protein
MKFKVGKNEIKWRRIHRSPYFISRDGEIYSERRKMILRGWGPANGYRMAILCYNGERHLVRHHHLVMRFFVGPRPVGFVINHKDGKKHNNRLSNLEYCTPQQNREHAKVNRLYSSGSYCSWAKLNEESALLIKRAHKVGMSHRQLARAFKVSKKAITKITTGKTWKYPRRTEKK